MTWQAILESKLLHLEGVSRAAIHGLSGACYASSANFTVSCVRNCVSERCARDVGPHWFHPPNMINSLFGLINIHILL